MRPRNPSRRARRTANLRRGAETVPLAPVEIEALLQPATEEPDTTATTVEMTPIEPRLARGTDAAPASHRGPRRPRTTLRVDEIVPPKKR